MNFITTLFFSKYCKRCGKLSKKLYIDSNELCFECVNYKLCSGCGQKTKIGNLIPMVWYDGHRYFYDRSFYCITCRPKEATRGYEGKWYKEEVKEIEVK